MKFSEKGLKSFDKQMTETVLSNNFEKWDRFSAIRQVTFEPDDFKDCVVLTTEEAKIINKLVYMASCAFILTNEQLDAEEMLEKRIKQAEMSKQST